MLRNDSCKKNAFELKAHLLLPDKKFKVMFFYVNWLKKVIAQTNTQTNKKHYEKNITSTSYLGCFGLILSRFYYHVHVMLFQQIIAYDEVITCS